MGKLAGRADDPPRPDREGTLLGLSPSGFHRITYVDWGPADDERPIICVHGVTRQGRDFDYLAAKLAASGRRVICPDLPGRGRSGRIGDPDGYSLPQYCSDMNALIARLGVREVDWVGSSLGGLIGMVMAGFSGSIVRKLVINDIGPYVSSTGLRRIGTISPRCRPCSPRLLMARNTFAKCWRRTASCQNRLIALPTSMYV